jgi:hypothetical protein
MNIRGMTLDRRLKLKVVAISKGILIYRLLGEIEDYTLKGGYDELLA